MIKEVATKKELQSMLQKLEGETIALQAEISCRQKELSSKQNSIRSLKDKISNLDEVTIPKVSEHALLRYFERILQYDLQIIEEEILSDKVKNMITTLGNTGKYPNEKGYVVILKNNNVVSITRSVNEKSN